MIKKIATIMALALGLSMVSMVPASAVAGAACDLGAGNDVTIVLTDGATAAIGVDDDGHVWCDDDNGVSVDAFADEDLGDEIDDVSVTGTGTIIVVLDDTSGDAADFGVIDDFEIEIDGTISFDGSAVEDDSLSVTLGSSTFSLNGFGGFYEDDDVSLVEFLDGERSDTFNASSADVELDVTLSEGGYDVVYGGSDDDTVTVSSDDRSTVFGNDGDDTLTDNGDDTCNTFYGGDDHDDIVLDGDNCDVAFPGAGNDDVEGAVIVSYADLGSAVSITDNGEDTETGLAAGDDEFTDAPEQFIGTSRGDLLVGGVDGEAALYGGAGNDTIRSFNSNRVYGGLGDDLLIGSDGVVNYLYGGAGADTLRGRSGSDYLIGGVGRDIVYGGRGNDVCAGEVMYTCEFVR